MDEWASGQVSGMGLCPDACAMGGYGAWVLGHGHGDGGTEGSWEVHADTCMVGVHTRVYMCVAQEEEKCLAADAGRLTHGRAHGTYCHGRIECLCARERERGVFE